MKKLISVLLIILFLSTIMANGVSAATVFLTSDNVLGESEDFEMLNEIKEYIEEKTNGEVEVVVDSQASNPGEGTRVMNAECDYAVTIAYACSGNLLDLAEYSVKTNKTIISVNAGYLDLNKLNFLRRSYDDDWSDYSFAAIKSPGQFLTDSGIVLLQPGQKYPDETENGNIDYSSSKINEYIAESVVDTINNGNNQNRELDEDLIVKHNIHPSYLAEISKLIVENSNEDMKESYGSYKTQQALYMSSSYLVGYSLDIPKDYQAPDSPDKYSLFAKSSYSFNDYCNMADLVVDYMDENGKAPNYIEYDGARISYYDLVYNFALLTENHTDASHMNFSQNSEFHKYYDNTLLNLLPIAIIIILIIAVITILIKIRNRIRLKKQRRRYNQNNQYYNNRLQVKRKNNQNYYNNDPQKFNFKKRR